MPNPNDPALEQQKKELGAQIDALEQQIEDAPDGADTSALETQLEQLEAQMRALQQQRKTAREANRTKGKAGAPGQQKKTT